MDLRTLFAPAGSQVQPEGDNAKLAALEGLVEALGLEVVEVTTGDGVR